MSDFNEQDGAPNNNDESLFETENGKLPAVNHQDVNVPLNASGVQSSVRAPSVHSTNIVPAAHVAEQSTSPLSLSALIAAANVFSQYEIASQRFRKQAEEHRRQEEHHRRQANECMEKANLIDSTIASIREGNVAALDDAAIAALSSLDLTTTSTARAVMNTTATTKNNPDRVIGAAAASPSTQKDNNNTSSLPPRMITQDDVPIDKHTGRKPAPVATAKDPPAAAKHRNFPRKNAVAAAPVVNRPSAGIPTAAVSIAAVNRPGSGLPTPVVTAAQAKGISTQSNSAQEATRPSLKRSPDVDLSAHNRPGPKQARLEKLSITPMEVAEIGQNAIEQQVVHAQLENIHDTNDAQTDHAGTAATDGSHDYVLIRKENDSFENSPVLSVIWNLTWDEVVADSPFIETEDVGCAPDDVTVAVAQCLPCALTEDNRIGRYKHQELGYLGLMCQHCFGQPGYGRYFPSTKSSFVSSFPQTIVSHVQSCVGAPQKLKYLVKELGDRHQKSRSRHKKFSGTKGLLEHVWDRLHSYQPDTIPQRDNKALEQKVLNSNIPYTNLQCQFLFQQHDFPDECLVSIPDYSLVPDALFAAFTQVKACYADDVDCRNIGRNRARIEPGFKGICCIHCVGSTNAFRFFPATAESLSQIDTCSKLCSHLLRKCKGVPSKIREAMAIMKDKEKEEPRRYGSRKTFFSRLWARLHPDENEILNSKIPHTELEFNVLFGQHTISRCLVTVQEYSLVPDALFTAFTQVKTCLADCSDLAGDQTGIEPGSRGICCLHCEGETSAFRFFPTSEESLMQADTSTKLKNHMLHECKHLPIQIREAITITEEKQIATPRTYENSATFFIRLWKRLHSEEEDNTGERSDYDDADVCLEIDGLVDASTLVQNSDKGMVSDGYLAAFSLLNSCSLTEDDQKGWYSDREIGFPGVCCKYCGGRRTSGRYFPRPGPFFLRSSKHAIVRHLETCPKCPEDVKKKVYALHKRDEARLGWKVDNEAALGSGKKFYERFWRRLYTELGVQDKRDMPEPEEPLGHAERSLASL